MKKWLKDTMKRNKKNMEKYLIFKNGRTYVRVDEIERFRTYTDYMQLLDGILYIIESGDIVDVK